MVQLVCRDVCRGLHLRAGVMRARNQPKTVRNSLSYFSDSTQIRQMPVANLFRTRRNCKAGYVFNNMLSLTFGMKPPVVKTAVTKEPLTEIEHMKNRVGKQILQVRDFYKRMKGNESSKFSYV